MAESMSVKAILSAVDRGFTATMKSARASVGSLGKTVASGIGFGILTGAGMAAFNAIGNGARNLVSEIDSSNSAWKTFEGNMKILGKTNSEIKKVKGSMQSYAEQTIYSSSDMASTYAQMAAVGVKSADKLVTGFGGLAAAAENPKQAMKTLSQQATQMAARPKVAWQDFKLMLDQTPAGIAAVAKEMGMSVDQLVQNVQDGTVATEEFFDAIEKVGNSKGFSDLATQYKTVGQAMDGLYETLGNKLGPSFEVLSQAAIGSISGIIDKIGQIDAEALATKVSSVMEDLSPYFNMAKSAVTTFGSALLKVGGFLADHSSAIATLIPIVLGLVLAYKGFKTISGIVSSVSAFASALLATAGAAVPASEGLEKTSKGTKKTGKACKASAKQILSAGAAFLMLGAGIGLAAVGFALLAQSAIALAGAGGAAIAVMAGMVIALSGIMALAAVLGPALTAGAVGFVAFGAGMVLVGAGALLAAAALTVVAGVLPQIVTYGTSGAMAIAQLGVAMLSFAAGAAISGASCLILAAGLLALGVGAIVAAAGAIVLAAGVVLLSAAMIALAAGVTVAGSGMTAVAMGMVIALAAAMPLSAVLITMAATIVAFGAAATASAVGIAAFGAAVTVAAGGALLLKSPLSSCAASMTKLVSAASVASGALARLVSALASCAGQASSAGTRVGNGFATGLQSGMNRTPGIAGRAVSTVSSTLRGGYGPAYSAGSYISQGFANGMESCLGRIQAAANKMVAAANKAIQAKAKIGSPSKVTTQYGKWYGQGAVNGITAMVGKVAKASQELFALPTNMQMPSISASYGGELSADYSYNRGAEFAVEVPLSVDGKVFARATAVYTQEELNKRQNRENRKRGKI